METFIPTVSAEEKPERKILSVSQITGDIKRLLENQLGQVWIKGEVSNLRIPASGHAYFTLKDENAQLSAVLFRNRMQNLKFELQDGMEVISFGKISVYEVRGSYQVIVDYIEPAGLGLLQAAFEKLKEKLNKEGLFDPARKRPLPYLPQRIGIVTSATGAAIRDMLKVLGRRNPKVSVLLAQAKVQGEGAAQEIAKRIEELNEYHAAQTDERLKLDLLIVGRGGGSLEDLWAFNEEVVARAIFNSKLPVVSAVGHEIDVTISDFVADVRAPTPSAAAEIVTPVLSELEQHLDELLQSLKQMIWQLLKEKNLQIKNLSERMLRPDRRLSDLRIRVDDWMTRMIQSLGHMLQERQAFLKGQKDLLLRASPLTQASELRLTLVHLGESSRRAIEKILFQARSRVQMRGESLHALSPLNILNRGYAVARDLKSKQVLRDAEKVRIGQILELILEKGSLQANVTATTAVEGKEEKVKEVKKPEGLQRPLWS